MGSPHTKPRVFEVIPVATGTVIIQFNQSVTVDSKAVLATIHGGKVIVDLGDLNILLIRRWNIRPHRKTAYVSYSGRTENLRLHNLLLPPRSGLVCDHINRAGWDNRRSNLRLTDACGQARNQGARRNKLFSAYKGVTFDATKQLFRARIMVNRKAIGLGRYKREEDAAKAYDAAARRHFGEFAVLNFPNYSD